MMPVGTPPNAIVFGTGLVHMPQMIRAGLWLNLAGIVVIFVLTYAVLVPTLGSGRIYQHQCTYSHSQHEERQDIPNLVAGPVFVVRAAMAGLVRSTAAAAP